MKVFKPQLVCLQFNRRPSYKFCITLLCYPLRGHRQTRNQECANWQLVNSNTFAGRLISTEL